MSVTEKIEAALANPIRSEAEDQFDIHGALGEVLAAAGMSEKDSGGKVEFVGADPVVPSAVRLGAAPAIGLVAKSVALAALWRHRGGPGQDISMDLRQAPHRLCPFYDKKWELLNGLPPTNTGDPGSPLSLSFYRAGDGRWVMPLNIYPKLKSKTLKLLRTYDDSTAIANAVARWSAAELEEAGSDAGLVMPMVRSTEEFLATRQYRDVLADLPLIEIEKIGDSAPSRCPRARNSRSTASARSAWAT